MQAVVQLPLKSPLKLRMIEIARMNIERVRVHRDWRVLEVDRNLDALALFAGAKRQ